MRRVMTEIIAQRIGPVDFRSVEAEKMILLFMELTKKQNGKGFDAIRAFCQDSTKPEIMRDSLKKMGENTLIGELKAIYVWELENSEYRGKELLDRLIASEGSLLILRKENPLFVYEYLAGFFGEKNYKSLRVNLKSLYLSMVSIENS